MEKVGIVFTVLLLLLVCVRDGQSAQECIISADCGDTEGRTMCFASRCRKDVPCTKDNDCFFYGASDITAGRYHPLCFMNTNVATTPNYGICMIEEAVTQVTYKPGITRYPGEDVDGVLDSTTIAKCRNY